MHTSRPSEWRYPAQPTVPAKPQKTKISVKLDINNRRGSSFYNQPDVVYRDPVVVYRDPAPAPIVLPESSVPIKLETMNASTTIKPITVTKPPKKQRVYRIGRFYLDFVFYVRFYPNHCKIHARHGKNVTSMHSVGEMNFNYDNLIFRVNMLLTSNDKMLMLNVEELKYTPINKQGEGLVGFGYNGTADQFDINIHITDGYSHMIVGIARLQDGGIDVILKFHSTSYVWLKTDTDNTTILVDKNIRTYYYHDTSLYSYTSMDDMRFGFVISIIVAIITILVSILIVSCVCLARYMAKYRPVDDH